MTALLGPGDQRCWDHFAQGLPAHRRPVEPRVSAGYAGTPEITDDLVARYLDGRKTAGSSLVADFLAAGDPLPAVGDFWICWDGAGEPACILRTERVETHRFLEVPASVARAEGEGDGSLERWRRVHADLYEPQLAGWGLQRIEDADVVTEHLAVVHVEPRDGRVEARRRRPLDG